MRDVDPEAIAALNVAGIRAPAVLALLRATLINCIKSGVSLDHAVSDLRIQLAPHTPIDVDPAVLETHRLETIVRSVSAKANNWSRLRQARDPDMVNYMAGIKFSAIVDSRTSSVCQFLHGKVFRTNDKAVDQLCPPLHRNCRCMIVPITKSDARKNPISHISTAEIDHAIELLRAHKRGIRA